MEQSFESMNGLQIMVLLNNTVQKLIEEKVDGDLYIKAVARAFDIKEDAVTLDQRQLCKEASFGTRYGVNVKKLKDAAGV